MNLLTKLIDIATKDKEVAAVMLFGSVARKDQSPVSDIDVCVILRMSKYTPKFLSEKKLHYLKQVDLDIQIYQQVPLYIRQRVLKEGKILYCRDEDELYDIAFKTIQEYGDFEHGYREYLNEVAHA